MEYCLFYCGYQCFNELSTYIDFEDYKEPIIKNFKEWKRRNVRNCLAAGIVCKKLEQDNEITEFYQILCENLLKYQTTPVHTLKELIQLKTQILPEEVDFYGAYLENKMIAGTMLFYFHAVQLVHTQYLCASAYWDHLSPMTYIYFSMIAMAREKGFRKISFGISTEDKGRILNYGLTRSKEAYGGKHCLNKKFCKML